MTAIESQHNASKYIQRTLVSHNLKVIVNKELTMVAEGRIELPTYGL
jgi:hypothetical protein